MGNQKGEWGIKGGIKIEHVKNWLHCESPQQLSTLTWLSILCSQIFLKPSLMTILNSHRVADYIIQESKSVSQQIMNDLVYID